MRRAAGVPLTATGPTRYQYAIAGWRAAKGYEVQGWSVGVGQVARHARQGGGVHRGVLALQAGLGIGGLALAKVIDL